MYIEWLPFFGQLETSACAYWSLALRNNLLLRRTMERRIATVSQLVLTICGNVNYY